MATAGESNPQVPSRGTQWFPSALVELSSEGYALSGNAREARQRAYQTFLLSPSEKDPLYKKYSHLGSIDLSGLASFRSGRGIEAPAPAAGEVVVVHDSRGTTITKGAGISEGGVEALSIAELLAKDSAAQQTYLNAGDPLADKFGAMNLALLTHGYYLSVPDGLTSPVRVREISVLSGESQSIAVRRYIHTGRQGNLFHSEEVQTLDGSKKQRLYSSSTILDAGEDSEVVSMTSHAPDGNTVSFYNRNLSASTNSHVYWVFAGIDGFRTTLRNTSSLDRRGAEVTDLEVFFADEDQSCASAIRVLQEAGDTRGQSISRGVFKGNARGTFTGMMRIDPKVSKVFSNLSEHAMLLTRTARAETAPGMEILSSNDVKASHSSSVAPIDPEKIFYLESRGVHKMLAVRVIVEGFLASALAKCPLIGVDDFLRAEIDERWENRSLRWDGKGKMGSLKPTSAAWRDSGELRIDEKLR